MREEQVPRPLGKSFLTRRKGVKVNNCTEGRKGKCRKGGKEEKQYREGKRDGEEEGPCARMRVHVYACKFRQDIQQKPMVSIGKCFPFTCSLHMLPGRYGGLKGSKECSFG